MSTELHGETECPRRRRTAGRGIRLRVGATCLVAVTAMIASVAAFAATSSSVPRGWKPGWLVSPAAYLGRYKLVSSSPGSPQGQLTLFIQEEFPGKPGVPSGIVSLRTASGTVVLYLTDLDHDGKQRLSLVHGGAFVAPATGSFTVATLGHGIVAGTLKQKGLTTQRLTFKRFSTSSQP